MSSLRLSTVYDLSSLRLRPDGTRISQDTSNGHTSAAIQDLNGNWIARDAGGSGRVIKRRRVELAGELDEENEEIPILMKGKGRASKRRENFNNDLEFLESQEHKSQPGKLPLPSSDLLKCIHYLASKYYNDRGQLIDASHQFRIDRKERRRRRVGREASKSTTEFEEEMTDGENQNEQNFASSVRTRDMYKRFDGSALLALGMLLQEHVARLLEHNIPEPGPDEYHTDTTVSKDLDPSVSGYRSVDDESGDDEPEDIPNSNDAPVR